MLMGYSLDHWIDLGEYIVMVTGLFLVACLVSVRLSNYFLKEEIKEDKLKIIRNKRTEKADKKKHFIDVA